MRNIHLHLSSRDKEYYFGKNYVVNFGGVINLIYVS